MPAPDPGPDRLLAGAEVRRRVQRAMARLSPLERAAFTLRHFEGMGTAEIADALLAPHLSYAGALRPLLDEDLVHAMAHITGGGFFDNIPHDVILRGLRNVVADGNILNLTEKFLTAGVLEDGVVQSTTLGTPQGGVLSPLLANIALNFLDWHLDDLGLRCVRYADDFVVLCRTELQVKEAQTRIEAFLKDIGLSLSPTKTKITTFRKGFTFLGFDVSSYSMRMRAKSVENYQARVRDITTRSHNLEAEVVGKLNSVNRGVQRYFGTWFSTCVTQFRELDEWVRMRLRCQKLKSKSRTHNCRIQDAYFQRMGLLTLSALHRQSRQTVRGCSSAEAIPSPARPRRKTGSAAGPPGARKTHAGK